MLSWPLHVGLENACCNLLSSVLEFILFWEPSDVEVAAVDSDWNKNDFQSQTLRHHWGSAMFTEIISKGTGIWSQACLISKPTHCVTTELFSPVLSAGQDHVLIVLQIIVAKNHAVCKYPLSIFLVANSHPTASRRPSRLLPWDA